MAWTVERVANVTQTRPPRYGDYSIALKDAQQFASESGQEYAIFDGDHELQEIVQPARSFGR